MNRVSLVQLVGCTSMLNLASDSNTQTNLEMYTKLHVMDSGPSNRCKARVSFRVFHKGSLVYISGHLSPAIDVYNRLLRGLPCD